MAAAQEVMHLMTTVTKPDDDALLPHFGYKQQFVRSLKQFE